MIQFSNQEIKDERLVLDSKTELYYLGHDLIRWLRRAELHDSAVLHVTQDGHDMPCAEEPELSLRDGFLLTVEAAGDHVNLKAYRHRASVGQMHARVTPIEVIAIHPQVAIDACPLGGRSSLLLQESRDRPLLHDGGIHDPARLALIIDEADVGLDTGGPAEELRHGDNCLVWTGAGLWPLSLCARRAGLGRRAAQMEEDDSRDNSEVLPTADHPDVLLERGGG
jgi:hypothetical protein